MRLTAHINSSQERMAQMEHRLGQVGLVVMGFLEGRLESLMEEEREEGTTELLSLLEAGTSGASGNSPGNPAAAAQSLYFLCQQPHQPL